ncbi:MAG: hypothetical protein QNJ53_16450 [Pleurocapsa sp. MO_192.B19]|nr:hypothetical protein [Pleurocapsa sp. MO_192.B19]
MLFLDYTQVKSCKLQGKDNKISGIIYNGKTFVRVKAFPKEELEAAIKECREEYLDHEERSKIATLLIKEKNGVGIWMHNTNYKLDSTSTSDDENHSSSETQSVSIAPVKSQTDTNRISLRQLALEMRSEKGVEIKTRRYKLKLYQHCFLGNEAVDWIAQRAKLSRPNAIKLGQHMMDKGLFHHVLDEHQFKDEALFYRFKDDEGKSIWNSSI